MMTIGARVVALAGFGFVDVRGDRRQLLTLNGLRIISAAIGATDFAAIVPSDDLAGIQALFACCIRYAGLIGCWVRAGSVAPSVSFDPVVDVLLQFAIALTLLALFTLLLLELGLLCNQQVNIFWITGSLPE